ncbi:MAG: DUF4214 domain-containing protein [Actinomycetota bacterium]
MLAGAALVATVPLLDRAGAPSGTERVGRGATDGIDGAGGDGDGIVGIDARPGRVVTVSVAFEPGWVVPQLAGRDQGVTATGLPEGREPGAETVGATVAVPSGSESFVVRSPIGRSLAFRIRIGATWTSWNGVGIGEDEAPDGLDGEEGAGAGPPAAIPILLTPGARTIELADRWGSDEPIELVFLPGFDGPTAEVFDEDFDGPAAPALAGADAPAIQPRSSWTSATWAGGNASCGSGPGVADHLQAVIVHHTVTANDYQPDQVDDLLRAIHYSHTEINGWCDIGYNFVVDRFGRIWEARTGSIAQSVIGGHARGFNHGTMGVALLGQHHAGAWPPADTVSEASRDAVEVLANWKLGAEGVDPNGRTWLRNRSGASRQRLTGETWHHVPTVLGHRDVGLTSCPGSNGMDVVDELPDRLARRVDTTPPYEWVGWRANDNGPAFAIADARGGIRPAGTANPWSSAPSGVGGGSVIAVGGNVAGGYLLTSAGALVAYGAAPAPGSPVAAGGPIDLVVRSDGSSGWLLDGTGVLRGFGGAPDISSGVSGPVAADLDDNGRGQVVTASGLVVGIGGVAGGTVDAGGATVVDVASSPDGGGWVLDSSGRLLGFGGRGDSRVDPAAAPVAVVAASTEPGGWVLDRHGQLWPFGGARYVLPVATDARSGDAVDVAGLGAVYGAGFLASSDARWAGALHQLFLGRSASDAELDVAVTRLEQGSDRLDLTTELARSDHWAGSELDQMYLDVLGRQADPDGRRYWMGQIGAGLKLQDLGTYFYGSTEYARSAGSETGYVRGLYLALLGREPDAEGLAYWAGELTSGRAAPPDIAAGFYASVESRRSRAARLHRRILGSEPSAARRDELADRLPVVGDVGLAAELAAGADYYRQAASG